ncbi:hypothetical protein SCP_0100240 [Sparassis crispa]|uniref:Uncharacterized protein n=1 Tax=Sparassis crispa TaxID=139825 RepID=A0A401G4T3_9APHY|nr:hypothetical protein SCP_0100240 [Sparassis crispa]GBE77152.1 hypothetical protein SCP_0100240 [Sparassis crispa]
MYSNYLTLIPLIEHIGGQLRLYPAHVLAIQTDDVDSGGPVSYATIMAGVAAHGRQSVPSLLHSLLTAVSNADYRRIHDLSRLQGEEIAWACIYVPNYKDMVAD